MMIYNLSCYSINCKTHRSSINARTILRVGKCIAFTQGFNAKNVRLKRSSGTAAPERLVGSNIARFTCPCATTLRPRHAVNNKTCCGKRNCKFSASRCSKVNIICPNMRVVMAAIGACDITSGQSGSCPVVCGTPCSVLRCGHKRQIMKHYVCSYATTCSFVMFRCFWQNTLTLAVKNYLAVWRRKRWLCTGIIQYINMHTLVFVVCLPYEFNALVAQIQINISVRVLLSLI